MKLAFLFAGQGAQYVGMGKELYETNVIAKQLFDEASLDFDIKQLCFEGPSEQLNNTAYAQSCILLTSYAIAKALQTKGFQPDYVAGLSLGEYSALCFADAFSIHDALQMVRKRGQIMESALPLGTTTMAAVLQCEASTIQKVCEAVTPIGVCEIANYNYPGQIVISGEVLAIQAASELLKEQGARRIIPLNVSGAFHTSLLEEASKQLATELNKYEITSPKIPVIYNISGKEEKEAVSQILNKQIKSSVYFSQSIEYLIQQGVDTFIEIGPGKTLAGFVKKIDRNVKVFSIETLQDIEAMIGVQDGK